MQRRCWAVAAWLSERGTVQQRSIVPDQRSLNASGMKARREKTRVPKLLRSQQPGPTGRRPPTVEASFSPVCNDWEQHARYAELPMHLTDQYFDIKIGQYGGDGC